MKLFKKILFYISGKTALINTPNIVTTQGLDVGLNYLKKIYPLYKPVTVRFLIFLYQYLIHLELDNSFNHLKPGTFVIHFCCWGKNYTDKAKNYLLPSLNTKNNLQKIIKTREVVILIHCDQIAKKELIESSIVKDLQKHMRIFFLVIPQTLLNYCNARFNYPNLSYFKTLNRFRSNNKYFLLGAVQTHALKVALYNKAYISFMMPDFLLSDSFFKYAFSKIKNKTAVVTTTFRTNFANVKPEIKSSYENLSELSLSITAEKLTQLQIKHIHPAAKRRIVSESTLDFAPTAQLIFEVSNGFVIRAFHYHPILIDCSKIKQNILFDYLAIDYMALNKILEAELPFEQQLWVCNHSSHMAVMELSEDDIEKHYDIKQSITSAQLFDEVKNMIANKPYIYDTPLNRYFASIRHQVISEEYSRPTQEYMDDVLFFLKLAPRSNTVDSN